jgi:predicted NodU family carbamoyl transferase
LAYYGKTCLNSATYLEERENIQLFVNIKLLDYSIIMTDSFNCQRSDLVFITDGYYLSTYLHIDKLSSAFRARIRHDQNISLWKKEKNNLHLVHYWELERLSGYKKHAISLSSKEQAYKLIQILLSEYNLTLDDINDIWGTPEIQKNPSCIYHSVEDFPDYTYHSISHLFSALLSDTDLFHNNTIITLAVDGGPDCVVDLEARNKKYYIGCVSEQGKIKEVFHISSPALLWSYAKARFQMEQGSMMALASASTSKYLLEIQDINNIEDFETANKAYEWLQKLVEKIDILEDHDIGTKFSGYDERFSKIENRISMVMKVIQEKSIKILEYNLKKIIDKYSLRAEDTGLALSGGYILNCVGNSTVMNNMHFKFMIAPPCVSDTGQSLGIALYSFYKFNKNINFRLENSYYGDNDKNLSRILKDTFWKQFISDVQNFDPDTITKDIKSNPIVWFNGRCEIGPRALGARSLLADPSNLDSKNKLNIIKQRQWWRPVAPIILDQYLEQWFDECYSSPYMLNVFKIKSELVSQIPAIAHIDISARVQTLGEKDNPLLYQVLQSFHKDTGIPLLCNTSLNDKGEPIINKIDEAINFCLRKELKILYINGVRIELHNHIYYENIYPLERKFKFYFDTQNMDEDMKNYTELGLSQEHIELYYNLPHIRRGYSLYKQRDVEVIKKMYAKLEKYRIPDD